MRGWHLPKHYDNQTLEDWEGKVELQIDIDTGIVMSQPAPRQYLPMSPQELFQYDMEIRARDFSADPQAYGADGEQEMLESFQLQDRFRELRGEA
jgi:hypothetical protein